MRTMLDMNNPIDRAFVADIGRPTRWGRYRHRHCAYGRSWRDVPEPDASELIARWLAIATPQLIIALRLETSWHWLHLNTPWIFEWHGRVWTAYPGAAAPDFA